MQRNMHICRQICISYARICTLGANVSFAYMHVHIVTALIINLEAVTEFIVFMWSNDNIIFIQFGYFSPILN